MSGVTAEPDDRAGRPASWRTRVLQTVRWVVIAAVVVVAVWYFATMWDTVAPELAKMHPAALAGSFAALLAGLMLTVLSWTTLLNGLGHPVPFIRGAQIMLVGQLGKYVPGSAWAYLLQMEIGRQYGIARARVLVASLYAAGVGVVASLVLAVAALPQLNEGLPQVVWIIALLPVGLACLLPQVMTFLANLVLKLFRRTPLGQRVKLRTTLGALGWSIGSYVLYGVHLWLLTGGEAAVTDILLCAAAIGMGFTVSLFAFLLPSGVGVREAVLIGCLGLVLSAGQASAIALVSRGMFTAGDLITAGAAALTALVLRRRLHRADVVRAEYSDVANS